MKQTPSTLERIHLLISGVVQGVGFRRATQAKAEELGVVGWVRNTSEGEVELIAEGERVVIESLIRWCHEGPRLARVKSVKTLSRAPVQSTESTDFQIV